MPDGVYGKHLFGSWRDDVDEPDTPPESALAQRVVSTYEGWADVTHTDINALLNLRNKGHYTDILAVPEKYKKAYRVIEISTERDPELAGIPRLDEPVIIKPKLINKKINLKRWKDNPVVSWTVDIWAVVNFLTDSIYAGSDAYVVFSCDLSANRDNFLLNPSKTGKLSGSFKWQEEIWQVGTVSIEKWAVCSKEILEERPDTAIKIAQMVR